MHYLAGAQGRPGPVYALPSLGSRRLCKKWANKDESTSQNGIFSCQCRQKDVILRLNNLKGAITMLLNTKLMSNVKSSFKKGAGHAKGAAAFPFKVDGKVVFFN
jgi:hypothetical protein